MIKRNIIVDYMKAIGLMFIIVYHIFFGPVYSFWQIGNLFGVPLLFMLSGYTSNYDKYTFKEYFIKKFKTLFLPALLVNIFFILYGSIRNLLYFYAYNGYVNFNTSMNIIVYFIKDNLIALITRFDPFILSKPPWFLVTLFFATILFKFIYDIIKKTTKNHSIISSKMLIIFLVLVIIFYYFIYSNDFFYGYYLDIIPISCLFIAVGYFKKHHKFKMTKLLDILFLISSIALIFICLKYKISSNWWQKAFPNIILLLLTSLAFSYLYEKIIIGFKNIFTKLKVHSNFLTVINKHAIDIILFHGFALFTLDDIMKLFHSNVHRGLYNSMFVPFTIIVYTLGALVISIGFGIILRKIVKKIENLKERKIKKKLNYILIIILVVVNTLLLRNTFFIYNDFDNLMVIQSYKELILNLDVLGVILKIINNMLGMNYMLYSLLMLLIHLINTIMIYNIVKKIKNNDILALVVTLLFSLYPTTIYATFNYIGLSELLGMTMLLLMTKLFINKKYVGLIITYLIGIKINQSLIFIPIIMLIIELIRKGNKKYLIGMTVIMIIDLIIGKYQLFNINIFKYICFYFHPNSYIFDYNQYEYSYIVTIVLLIIGMILYGIVRLKKKDYIPMILIVSLILLIIPIKEMSSINLYIPSIIVWGYLSVIVVDITKKAVDKKIIYPIVVLVLIIGVNNLKEVKDNRELYKKASKEYLKAYEYFENLSNMYPNIDTISVITYDKYELINVLDNKNNLIKKAMNKPNLKVTIGSNEEINYSSDVVVTYEEFKYGR